MRRFVVFILITTSSKHAVFTSDTPNCLTETGSQRTEFWDNESQECVLCSPCTDDFEIRIPCSMFEDATCQDSSDKSLLDTTFGQKTHGTIVYESQIERQNPRKYVFGER